MIPFDSVREAVLSETPWSQLDRLVRAELLAGRTTKQIFDELRAISDEVRKTPGLTDDGKEALGDTLDALIGFCSGKYAYADAQLGQTNGDGSETN